MVFKSENYRIPDQAFSRQLNASKPKQIKPAKKIMGLFLKGPIPLPWLQKAGSFRSGSTLKVALVIFHLAGLKKSLSGLVLTIERCKTWGVDRKGVRKALDNLEAGGLVSVERVNGRAPKVDILIDQYLESKL